MNEITSLNNEIVKSAVKLQQKKYRDESGLFLLEGEKPVLEAYNYGIELKQVFILKEKIEKYNFKNTDIILTNKSVLKKISTTDTEPDIIAIGEQKQGDKKLLQNSDRVILLENISDAGNLGTIIRTAVAFNIKSIILYGNTVDLYNPKTVRSSVGNIWKTNIIKMNDLKELDKYFHNYERVATLPLKDGGITLQGWKPKKKVLVMFGSEADGLSNELIKYSTTGLTIEMNNNVESLNLAISTGIILYKLY